MNFVRMLSTEYMTALSKSSCYRGVISSLTSKFSKYPMAKVWCTLRNSSAALFDCSLITGAPVFFRAQITISSLERIFKVYEISKKKIHRIHAPTYVYVINYAQNSHIRASIVIIPLKILVSLKRNGIVSNWSEQPIKYNKIWTNADQVFLNIINKWYNRGLKGIEPACATCWVWHGLWSDQT